LAGINDNNKLIIYIYDTSGLTSSYCTRAVSALDL